MESTIETTWGIKEIVFFNNTPMYAISRPTTEEDNFGGIQDKYDLFHIPFHRNNGVYSAMVHGGIMPDAKYVSYMKGAGESGALIVAGIRIPNPEISFTGNEF